MKEIVINANPYEKRVALLEDRFLTELYIERRRSKRINGNIYKGRVTRVLPGMQAAFLDIGLQKDAFLYVMDVADSITEFEYLMIGSDEEEQSDILPSIEEGVKSFHVYPQQYQPAVNIQDLIKEGQELLVQVTKEPLGTKGARVTTNITLPGRYLVYMPTVDHVGVSRRIEDKDEKARLKEMIQTLKAPNTGYIVRTVGEGKGEAEFLPDMEYLSKLWDKIQLRSNSSNPPCLIHRDLDIVLKTLRDILNTDIDRVVIDSDEEYERCIEFVETLMPNLTDSIKVYHKAKPIFDDYNIEKQIEEALSPKIWLKSGGYIVIDETEALVTIDVNTGKFVGEANLEETIYKTNKEAIQEIVRQIRLRDLGGIIIIDFIDMWAEENRQKLLEALETELKKDRMRSKILQLTQLGLVEMTRKRIKQSLGKILTSPCPYCGGTGRVKSVLTICRAIQREIDRIRGSMSGDEILIKAHPDIASFFYKQEDDLLEHLENKYKKRITIKSEPDMHYEDYTIDVL
ncbi:Rne/Rng family ribonuclease [bacterium]|nr:Rne/Rng family ribonuclease [bacterium]